MKIIRLDEVDSTNEFLKRENIRGDIVTVAKRQTGGRGTKGRSFSSESGGLYVSFQREYGDFPAENAFKIMVNACTAVCKTLSSFGLNPVIRWANDVLVNGLKISGTLIENTLSFGHISRSIVGIGINVNNTLPAELYGIATSMRRELGAECEVESVFQRLLKNIRREYSVEEYKSYINWFGKDIILRRSGGEERATALDVSPDGKLVCRGAEGVFGVSSAEVSLIL